MPMLFSDGPESAMSHSIGYVVVLCLLFSLVESKLILPAHLAKMHYSDVNKNSMMHRVRAAIDGGLKRFVVGFYQPFLSRAIHYRYTVLSVFIAILVLSAGLFASGLVRYIGMPQIPHDFPRITIEMKQQSSDQATLDAMFAVEKVLKGRASPRPS